MSETTLFRAVTRWSQVAINGWYAVCGMDHGHLPIPPQFIYVVQKRPAVGLGPATIVCTHYMVMFGTLHVKEGHVMGANELLWDHGVHDIHLERSDFESVAQALAKAQRGGGQYEELVREREIVGIKSDNEALIKATSDD
jgi:hypothetical protein